ncbi:MAG: rod shape-determining protein RodA [Alphaproteobacteria bacterium]|nr:rod shape-determining protein RodA [Alphaproteobacteria bacterium]
MYKAYETSFRGQRLSFGEKFWNISFSYVLMIMLLGAIGVIVLYSAANGSWNPWASKQLMRFCLGFAVMFALAFVDLRWFLRYAYWFYLVVLLLLVAVEIGGHIGMGAQRWINLGFMKLQPSELMKIALVLALARYFNSATLQSIESIKGIVAPAAMVMVPVVLVMIQPDLGTAIMLLLTAGAMFFAVGVQLWKFAALLCAGAAAMPVAWHFLHNYQKNRVLTFLDPERDPLGAGYHIIQSKIALGSGGVFGKGFLGGTQSHLNFLPEKHTDFIFTMLSEEFGMIGGIVVIAINFMIIAYSYFFALRSASYFAKLMTVGLASSYFLYVVINISMVLGMLPVVGVPLPLISYGGTVIVSVMMGFGIILAANSNRMINIGKDQG